jgi:hypothetical protein
LFFRVFEVPLPRNAEKSNNKNIVLRAGADVRRFSVLFFLPPLGESWLVTG